MNAPLITNIQRFSLHDGAGIRTTVFFKGCPLACLWCHNPETQRYEAESLFDPGRCVHCGRCGRGLACPAGARTTAGKAYAMDALLALLLKDQPFYDESGGGVTLSGGEALAQRGDFVLELTRRLFEAGVRVNVDTCGHAPFSAFEAVLPYTDVFLYDLKAATPETHKRLTGADNALILENLSLLVRRGAKIHLRVPVVPEANGKELPGIAALAARYAPGSPVSLLPYHALGRDKRARLGKDEGRAFTPPTDAYMDNVAAIFRAAGCAEVTIGG